MPRWNVTYVLVFRMLLHAQGGGLFIDNGGSANLTSCQIYRNEGYRVVRAFCSSWTFLPAPRWNVTLVLALCILLNAGRRARNLRRCDPQQLPDLCLPSRDPGCVNSTEQGTTLLASMLSSAGLSQPP